MLTSLGIVALILSVLFMRNVGVIGGDGKPEEVEDACSEETSRVPSKTSSVVEKQTESV